MRKNSCREGKADPNLWRIPDSYNPDLLRIPDISNIDLRPRPVDIELHKPFDPKVIAARERRRKAQAEHEQKQFEARTQRQFAEFREIFQACLDRAKISADRCQVRDEGKFRSRSYQWILDSCLCSRLSTLIKKRSSDWYEGDIAR